MYNDNLDYGIGNGEDNIVLIIFIIIVITLIITK